MSNKELLLLFKDIAEGVDGDKVDMDSNFGQLFQKLGKDKSTMSLLTEKLIAFWHDFSCLLTSLGHSWENAMQF